MEARLEIFLSFQNRKTCAYIKDCRLFNHQCTAKYYINKLQKIALSMTLVSLEITYIIQKATKINGDQMTMNVGMVVVFGKGVLCVTRQRIVWICAKLLKDVTYSHTMLPTKYAN